ncbi:MAG: hypothetical protein AUJ92_03785 [Armatimonadetes bacterium CG2_30_59_28]|nr:MAG: hypothetical protein AUJ92_03785 [Armatimonadetes bacterium CG2_30_59_28]PIU66057.1 MAG: hypothetical protein COS85_06335 [Armatimonadetes bacterium CG07_land_8_20_14_0_80_59_28]PIX38442.1 MAG: hypothetical protein COZ56_20435 [Armatimonadetes bacterium CG_4_8_14_3_um_filter_58_9]PJB69357.1 MAG: hypothetical protein CO095_10060 [Armatimonadetes bacterium CG_4_9_14_3_um_filter_58_7]
MSEAPKRVTKRRVLLFGRGSHQWEESCPILRRYLKTIPGYEVDYVKEDLDVFTAERIEPYNLIVLFNTGGQLTVEQKRGLVEGVAAGKGFVGCHGAADSFRASPEYLAMIGGEFQRHPATREFIVSLTDNKHPVTKDIKGYEVKDWEPWPIFEYKVYDEQYLLDSDPRVHVLATTTFRGSLWPVAWVKPWGQGKVFYTILGHHPGVVREEFFKQLFIGGAKWAGGKQPYRKPKTDRYDII